EPTVGMDLESRGSFVRALEELVTEGIAVLYSTHQLTELESAANRLLLIDQGRILFDGTPHEVSDRIRLRSVRFRFTGDPAAVPQLPGVQLGRTVGGAVHITVS